MIQTIPINLPESIVEQFCQRYQIQKLSLFGSILRDDFSPESDIDCLVEFTPEHVPGLFCLSIMQDELSTIVARVVDLRTPNELSNYFRDRVLAEAMVIYDSN
jgi:uncharacterized protein